MFRSYITNGCCEYTGHTNIILSPEQLNKLSDDIIINDLHFNGLYTVLYTGKIYQAMICEIPYKDEFWRGEDDGFDTEEDARIFCNNFINSIVTGHAFLELRDEMPGRFEIIIYKKL